MSVAAAAAALAAIFRIPALAAFLHLGPLRAGQVLLCIAAAVALLAALEGVKLVVRRLWAAAKSQSELAL